MDSVRKPGVMSTAEVRELLEREFSQVMSRGSAIVIEDVWHGGCRVRRAFSEKSLRPGGTISGPTLMAMVDCGFYLLLMARLGPVAMAVTTSLTINFMRKPEPGDLLGEGRLLKLGKALAVGDFTIWSAAVKDPVAHATVTYSIPPQRQ